MILAYHDNHPTVFPRDAAHLMQILCDVPPTAGATLWDVDIREVADVITLCGLSYNRVEHGVYHIK